MTTRALSNVLAFGITLASGLLTLMSTPISAQRAESSRVTPSRGTTTASSGRGGREAVRETDAGNKNEARQKALARQVRQAFAGVVRDKLHLNPYQAKRIEATDQRFTKQRNQVLQSERQARVGLQTALTDTTAAPNQAEIDRYLNQLVQAQRRRADLLGDEQAELATYLTPLQRAQYLALRERLNRRIDELRGAAPEPQDVAMRPDAVLLP